MSSGWATRSTARTREIFDRVVGSVDNTKDLNGPSELDTKLEDPLAESPTFAIPPFGMPLWMDKASESGAAEGHSIKSDRNPESHEEMLRIPLLSQSLNEKRELFIFREGDQHLRIVSLRVPTDVIQDIRKMETIFFKLSTDRLVPIYTINTTGGRSEWNMHLFDPNGNPLAELPFRTRKDALELQKAFITYETALSCENVSCIVTYKQKGLAIRHGQHVSSGEVQILEWPRSNSLQSSTLSPTRSSTTIDSAQSSISKAAQRFRGSSPGLRTIPEGQGNKNIIYTEIQRSALLVAFTKCKEDHTYTYWQIELDKIETVPSRRDKRYLGFSSQKNGHSFTVRTLTVSEDRLMDWNLCSLFSEQNLAARRNNDIKTLDCTHFGLEFKDDKSMREFDNKLLLLKLWSGSKIRQNQPTKIHKTPGIPPAYNRQTSVRLPHRHLSDDSISHFSSNLSSNLSDNLSDNFRSSFSDSSTDISSIWSIPVRPGTTSTIASSIFSDSRSGFIKDHEGYQSSETESQREVTMSGVGFHALNQLMPEMASYLQPQDTISTMDLNHSGSEIFEALRCYPTGTLLGNVLTVNGSGIDAQAATVEEYLYEHFRTSGLLLLEALQGLILPATPSRHRPHTVELKVTATNLKSGDPAVPEDTDCESILIHVEGHCAAILETAMAFSWISSAVRKWTFSGPEDLAFSDFQFWFTFRSRSDVSLSIETMPLVPLHPHLHSCWHDLFKKTTITRDAPLRERDSLRNPPSPTAALKATGLELSFSAAVTLAAAAYPFEYEEGIVLKGYSTVLVATEIVENRWNLDIQWHFQSSNDHIQLSDFTDKYTPWKASRRLTYKEVSGSRRSFIGWCRNAEITLGSQVPSPQITFRTSAKIKTSIPWEFKELAVQGGFNGLVTANVQAVMALKEDQQRFQKSTYFTNLIEDSRKDAVLIYAVSEDRGWLVPRLSVLHFMALLYVQNYRLEPELPTAAVSLEETRRILLENSEFEVFPAGIASDFKVPHMQTLRSILMKKHEYLEWVEEHVRRRRAVDRIVGRNIIFGSELYDIAIDQKQISLKKVTLKDTHGDWVRLLDKSYSRLSGVLFCDGLDDVIRPAQTNPPLCEKCHSVPMGKSYLCAGIYSLRNLQFGTLGCDLEIKSSRECLAPCSGPEHRLHKISTILDSKEKPRDLPQDGCMVFGKASGEGAKSKPQLPLITSRHRLAHQIPSGGAKGAISTDS